jgi:hypothetical protein
MSIHIHMYIYIFIYTHIYMYRCIYIYDFMYKLTLIYMHTYSHYNFILLSGIAFISGEIGADIETLDAAAIEIIGLVGYQRLAMQIIGGVDEYIYMHISMNIFI